MSRFRWYHYYFFLALFDVIVIVLSLRLHQQAVNHVRELLDAERQLNSESKWLQTAQKSVMELNAPGNNLFGVKTHEDYLIQQKLFNRARENMATTLREAHLVGLDGTRIAVHVKEMESKARELFEQFRPPMMPGDDSSSAGVANVVWGRDSAVAKILGSQVFGVLGEVYSDVLTKNATGPVMRDMDNLQHAALREIAWLAATNAQRRIDLIQQHERDIENQFVHQSFMIAGVLLILVGVLLFGRRLQEADRALTVERQRVKEARRERLAAIGELCSSVAHGIRNPLAAIRSSAQLALELGHCDDGTRERIQDILDEGRRLGDRVTGLLSMARVNADAFGSIDLRSIVDVGIKGLLPEIERRGLILETEISDKPVLVEGDRPRLEQCVVEYLSNAMEHSPEGGIIRVSCCIESDTAVIAVEDEGPGVPKAVRDRVFDLFFTTKPAGTGIGLATVKRIAKLHGGDAALADVSAGGARFTLCIPRMNESARQATDQGRAA